MELATPLNRIRRFLFRYRGAVVSRSVTLPKKVRLGRVKIAGNVSLGEWFSAADDVQILAGAEVIMIGDRVSIGPNTLIQNYSHDPRRVITSHFYENIKNKARLKSREISIGDDVWIGANCVIQGGVVIGDRVVIGANTVVGEDIPSDTLVTAPRALKVVERHYEPD